MNTLLDFLTDEVKEEIKEAQELGHFKWIEDTGFFTWFEVEKNDKLYIYINNLWIQPEYRGKTSIFWIRRFLRNKYPNVKYGYWFRGDKNNKEWHYSKKEK